MSSIQIHDNVERLPLSALKPNPRNARRRSDHEEAILASMIRDTLATWFAKGVSGNPKGRPRGAKGFRGILRAALEKPILVQDREGRTRRKRTIDVIVQREIAKALKGEDKALMRVQAQARVLDLEDESNARERNDASISARDRDILAHYAPELLQRISPSSQPSAKEESDEDPV